jgi:hypothetical protein
VAKDRRSGLVLSGRAAAVCASSGLTEPSSQASMNEELFRLLFCSAPLRVGDAMVRAKAATSDLEVRRTWILFGDPTMGLRLKRRLLPTARRQSASERERWQDQGAVGTAPRTGPSSMR